MSESLKLGKFLDSYETYNAAPHMRASILKHMLVTPAHFEVALKMPQVHKKCYDEGTVVHDVNLEQNTSRFIVLPADAPRKPTSAQINAKKPSDDTTAAIKWWTEFNQANEGKIIIDQELFDTLEPRLNAFAGSSEAMRLYNGANIEESFYAAYPAADMLLKARPDINKPGVITDFKTTANMKWFHNDIVKFGYHIQAGFHSLTVRLVTGIKTREFNWIVQEKTAPFGVRVFTLDETQIEALENRALELLMRASVCIRENKFPGYDDIRVQLKLPAYALNEESDFEVAV